MERTMVSADRLSQNEDSACSQYVNHTVYVTFGGGGASYKIWGFGVCVSNVCSNYKIEICFTLQISVLRAPSFLDTND